MDYRPQCPACGCNEALRWGAKGWRCPCPAVEKDGSPCWACRPETIAALMADAEHDSSSSVSREGDASVTGED